MLLFARPSPWGYTMKQLAKWKLIDAIKTLVIYIFWKKATKMTHRVQSHFNVLIVFYHGYYENTFLVFTFK